MDVDNKEGKGGGGWRVVDSKKIEQWSFKRLFQHAAAMPIWLFVEFVAWRESRTEAGRLEQAAAEARHLEWARENKKNSDALSRGLRENVFPRLSGQLQHDIETESGNRLVLLYAVSEDLAMRVRRLEIHQEACSFRLSPNGLFYETPDGPDVVSWHDLATTAFLAARDAARWDEDYQKLFPDDDSIDVAMGDRLLRLVLRVVSEYRHLIVAIEAEPIGKGVIRLKPGKRLPDADPVAHWAHAAD